jgi:predicted HicB family RNase H-like nuclease
MTKPLLSHLGFHGTAEVSYEDDCLHGKVLFIDDLITYEGGTPAGLKAAFIDAVDRYLAYCERTGKPANKPYSGTFNIRTGPEIHREACKVAAESEQSLNDFVRDCIVTCLTRRQFVERTDESRSQVAELRNKSVPVIAEKTRRVDGKKMQRQD